MTDDNTDDERLTVPAGVLRGIDDIDEGRTASKEQLQNTMTYR